MFKKKFNHYEHVVYNSNEVNEKEGNSFLRKYVKNINDRLTIILIVSSLVNIGISSRWLESLEVIFAILLAKFIVTLSQHNEEKSLKKETEECSEIKYREI